MASFSLDRPVLVAWLTTPLGCSTGSGSGSKVASWIAVSVIGCGLLARRPRACADERVPWCGNRTRRLAVVPVPVAVAVAISGTVVAVAVMAGVGVVGLGVVGGLVAPGERGQD